MQEILLVIIPSLITFFSTWQYNKTPKGKVEVKAADIENEIKSAAFYQNLIDDASRRLNDAIKAIEERDERIRQRDKRIDELIDQVELLTAELRKYKQLNGKSHDAIAESS